MHECFFFMRNNQQMRTEIFRFILFSVDSYIFQPPTVAFKEHFPDDDCNVWPKHVGGYTG